MQSTNFAKRHFNPILNRCLVWAQTHEWRGKHRFYLWMSGHFPHKLIRYCVQERSFSVPISELCFWLERGPNNYYLEEFAPFCDLLNDLDKPFTLLDLGADIGTVSSLVASRCTNLSNIIAFEPNPNSFTVLEQNFSRFDVDVMALNSAVSDFNGKANLEADIDRANDHEGQIIKTDTGAIDVVRLDSWFDLNPHVRLCDIIVIKIDVEGQEQQVLGGAKIIISKVDKVIVLLEIHPDVLRASNISPEHLLNEAEKIRDFSWFVPAVNIGNKLDRARPFFEQFEEKQYDIIGISIPR
ncbi:FkbM family methyltransferase [Paraglaciecola chathamensis]|uniref:FkbM family methyltransferase n=1 Tax=Paraglaciecola chathamensis TaxID=368405 RepID=UPI00270C5743|nr:FkbM family methyltransferase [Paraglaciecola chathamensis]MDO6558270.1 FkbM family methyltransferase [Paraglaciecola chathamensis]